MTRTRIDAVLLGLLLTACALWLVVPFAMAVLWSLVDPSAPWTAGTPLPPVMSLARWSDMWANSALRPALATSYAIAPLAALLALLLALPTAYALGRIAFPGREIAKLLCLLPLVLPSFVAAVSFSALLFRLGLAEWRFGAIVFAHAVLALPFAIRILTVSFEQVRQDHVDAARDLYAPPFALFRAAYLPALRPGVFAALVIVFVQSIEEFAIAFVVGAPDVVTIPTLLFSALGQDFVRPNAAVLSLVLVAPNVVLMLVLERLLRALEPAPATTRG